MPLGSSSPAEYPFSTGVGLSSSPFLLPRWPWPLRILPVRPGSASASASTAAAAAVAILIGSSRKPISRPGPRLLFPRVRTPPRSAEHLLVDGTICGSGSWPPVNLGSRPCVLIGLQKGALSVFVCHVPAFYSLDQNAGGVCSCMSMSTTTVVAHANWFD